MSEASNGKTRPNLQESGEDLYRHTPYDIYYALLKRGGKQFRQSLKMNGRTE